MDQHRISRFKASTDTQREIRGVVIQEKACTFCITHERRQLKGEALGRINFFAPTSRTTEGTHAIIGFETRFGMGPHHSSRDLRTRDKRQLGLVLIHPLGLQQFWERHACCMNFDFHAAIVGNISAM